MIDLRKLPDPLPIRPLTRPFDVTITPPGSKSITCRAYVLAALAEGESRIIRPLRADDTDHLLKALCTLGAEARWVSGETHDGEDVLIKGVAGRFPRGGHVYLGEGGTPTRFMIACACLAAEPVVVDASPRMRERPIAEGVEMLRQLGATIEYVEQEGRLPVRVTPSESFRGGRMTLQRTESSQFISAVLLIAPVLPKGITCIRTGFLTSESYVDLTLQTIGRWGVVVGHSCFSVSDGTHAWENRPPETKVSFGALRATRLDIEPDASSAVYWMVAAGITPSGKTYMPLVHWPSLQPDMQSVEALNELGIDVDATEGGLGVQGPRSLRWGLDVNAINMPDASLALAVAAVQCHRPSRITGLRTLRVKETDRIAALANELRKVGCTVETGDDWIEITPPPPPPLPEGARANRKDAGSDEPARKSRVDASSGNDPGLPVGQTRRGGQDALATDPVIIETYNDHRMAMSFAVLGLARPGLSIRNPACVSKSYPTFWDDFLKLYPPDDQPRELLDAMQ
jgi:3-phosphoshikimate 1-carboxyvinyltransferase